MISGGDRYVDGSGGMDWRLLGVLRLVHADGPDVTRSAAERAAGESIWVPTAMVATADSWIADDDHHLRVPAEVDGYRVELRHDIDDEGLVRSSTFLRWGDPDNSGAWAQHPFGVEVEGQLRFDGVTIPARGRAGWHFGTSRWDDSVFFTYEITRYEPITTRA